MGASSFKCLACWPETSLEEAAKHAKHLQKQLTPGKHQHRISNAELKYYEWN